MIKKNKNTCFIWIFFWFHHYHYSLALCQKWFGFNPLRTGKCSWLLYYYWCYQVCKGSSYAPIDPNKPKLWTNFPNIKNKPRTVGLRFEFLVGPSKLSRFCSKINCNPSQIVSTNDLDNVGTCSKTIASKICKVSSRSTSVLVPTQGFLNCLWKRNLMLIYCDLRPEGSRIE